MFKRLIASLICITFNLCNLQVVHAQDFNVNQLPVPGTMIGKSAPFAPLALKGLVVNVQKPLEFQFIVDAGHGPQDTGVVKTQANQLVKYFLAGLTIPEGDLWVNLSPYEKDRIVPEALGQTDLGRDLLAQDYILKQLTASLIYPEKDLGKEFWNRVYTKAQKQFGTTNIPVNTFNKVWILPDQAQVFENKNAAYVTKSTLKIMLDEDYLATQENVGRPGETSPCKNVSLPAGRQAQAGCQASKDLNTKASQGTNFALSIIREIVLPEITKEVNSGKNFAPLRQIYQALILAKWYKETIQNRLLDTLYTNKNRTAGVNLNDPAVKKQIYNRYLQAYKKGAFNYIKEAPTPDGQVVPRKYFSGGLIWAMDLKRDGAMAAVTSDGKDFALTVALEKPTDAAMTGKWDLGKLVQWFGSNLSVSILNALDNAQKDEIIEILNSDYPNVQKIKALKALGLMSNIPYRLTKHPEDNIGGAVKPISFRSSDALYNKHTFALRNFGLLRFVVSERFRQIFGLDLTQGEHTVIDWGTGYNGLGAIEMKDIFSRNQGIKVIATELASENYDYDIVIRGSDNTRAIQKIAGLISRYEVQELHFLVQKNPITGHFTISEVFMGAFVNNLNRLVYNAYAFPPSRKFRDEARFDSNRTHVGHTAYKRLVRAMNFQSIDESIQKAEASGHILAGMDYGILPSLAKTLEREGVGFKAVESLDGLIVGEQNSVSLIVAGTVLYNMNDEEKKLYKRMLEQTLKPGGIFIASTSKDVFGNIMEDLHIYQMGKSSLGYVQSVIINKNPKFNDSFLNPAITKDVALFYQNKEREPLTGGKLKFEESFYNISDLAMTVDEQVKLVPIGARVQFKLRGQENPAMVESGLNETKDEVTEYGGIDLNQIAIKRSGHVIKMPFDQAQLISLQQGGFEGFTPVTVNLSRISSPFQLLGVSRPAKE